jgi:cardiolipin synthase
MCVLSVLSAERQLNFGKDCIVRPISIIPAKNRLATLRTWGHWRISVSCSLGNLLISLMRHVPNLLTALRLVLTLIMFAALLAPHHDQRMVSIGLISFVLAAVTDFLDGWIARKFKVESLLGAILDPIADKVLVAGAIVGLVAAGQVDLAWPGGLILFREFAISALREVLAPRGLRLPVTLLAKGKTSLQLCGLGVAMAGLIWQGAEMAGLWLMWVAALLTVWTGIDYGLSARRALVQ